MQYALFEEVEEASDKVKNNKICVTSSTFKGGLDQPVHRWFRLTPSFGPGLVLHALAKMKTENNAVVFDPFSGAGTTLIEAKQNGFEAYGFEINPFLSFVGNTSLDLTLDSNDLTQSLKEIEKKVQKAKKLSSGKSIEELGLQSPPIHNVHRWWREDVLKDLLLLLQVIDQMKLEDKVHSFFRLSLAGILVPDLTNVTLGRLQLHFINRENDQINVLETFMAHSKMMIDDVIQSPNRASQKRAQIFNCDSTKSENFPKFPKINRVVTSPPYPNRYSYVWNTRPYLYLLGFFETAREAGNLDLDTIGGTWGSATSSLSKGILTPEYQVVREFVEPIAAEIRKEDNLMANYLMKYFNLLTKQIVAQHSLLSEDASLAYVVGCSRIKGIYVETDVILGNIFEGLGLGYRTFEIERFRKRHSDKNLYESTVFVKRE